MIYKYQLDTVVYMYAVSFFLSFPPSKCFEYCFALSLTSFEMLIFSLPMTFYLLKFGKIDPDEVEIRPRPNSYLHNVQNGEFVEPVEMYIETEQEGVVSHLSQIGPRPRSAR